MAMVERRVSDASILRLIGKWINVGVVDEGRLLTSETGTGQGQIISPLLANIYLHHVLDVWFETEVKPRLRGKAYARKEPPLAALQSPPCLLSPVAPAYHACLASFVSRA